LVAQKTTTVDVDNTYPSTPAVYLMGATDRPSSHRSHIARRMCVVLPLRY